MAVFMLQWQSWVDSTENMYALQSLQYFLSSLLKKKKKGLPTPDLDGLS